jgi:hypothetical protein
LRPAFGIERLKLHDPRRSVGKSGNGFKPEITVWVDPQTKLPLRIETTSKGEGGVTVTEVYRDIVFDGPLDAAIFDMTPPDGYRVESFGVARVLDGIRQGIEDMNAGRSVSHDELKAHARTKHGIKA